MEWFKKGSEEGNILTEDILYALIYANPRFLYDYFDDQNIVLTLDEIEIAVDGRKKAEEELFFNALKEMEESL